MKRAETLAKDAAYLRDELKQIVRTGVYESKSNGKITVFTLSDTQKEKMQKAIASFDAIAEILSE